MWVVSKKWFPLIQASNKKHNLKKSWIKSCKEGWKVQTTKEFININISKNSSYNTKKLVFSYIQFAYHMLFFIHNINIKNKIDNCS